MRPLDGLARPSALAALGLIVFQHEKVREVLAPLEKPFKWLGKLL